MEKCLVTGGAGFIGSHLVEELVQRSYRVRVLDDLSTGKTSNLENVQDRIDFRHGSITDIRAVEDAVRECEVIYHLAALASVSRSVEDPILSHQICATGTLHVLDAARRMGARRVVYAASSSAYGNRPGSIRREDDILSPLSPYAAAKLAGEHYCESFTEVFGLETVRLRFFNIFGPRQDASSPYSGVIALFSTAMVEGRVPRIDGDGHQSRDFNYVANVVDAMIRASVAPGVAGKVYNIGSGTSITILQLVAHLNELLGTNINPIHGPPRSGDVRHSQADISKAKAELGYEPRVSFREGLQRTVEQQRATMAER